MRLVFRSLSIVSALGLAIGVAAQDKPAPGKPAEPPKPAKPAEPPKGDHKPDAGKDEGAKVDNPEYKHWAQFKPGSFSKMKMISEMGDNKTEIVMTTTLKEVTPEKAVVEVATVTKMGDQEMKMPPQTRDILAKVSKTDADKYDNPEGKQKEGSEEIEVAGKKMKTKWYELENKVGDMTSKSKAWMCDDVPGRLVKMTSETSGQAKTKSSGELVEVKADKK